MLAGVGCSVPVQSRHPRMTDTDVVSSKRARPPICWGRVLRSPAIPEDTVFADREPADTRDPPGAGREREAATPTRGCVGLAEVFHRLLHRLLAEALRQAHGNLLQAVFGGRLADIVSELFEPLLESS